MKRKIFAIIIAALMLITSTAFADNITEDKALEYTFNKEFAENYTVDEMPKFNDEKDITKELDLLIRLNIISGYEDGTLKLDRTITRAEASRMLCYAVNPTETTRDIETQYTKEGIEKIKNDYAKSGIEFEYSGFTDVSLESWYHPYVYAAKNMMNCIGGYEDGTFRPENTVSEIEFLTMLERALGYSNMIEAEGGYPDGVTAISKRLNLLDNPPNAPATRERAVTMVYNALQSNIVTVDGFTQNENGTLEINYLTTNTLLEHRYVCKAHGILKKSSVLPEKTLVFIPDNDIYVEYIGMTFSLKKGNEYTFVKEYSDINEGEYDVYIDYSVEGNEIIVAAF
jgi:hypothetical protein